MTVEPLVQKNGVLRALPASEVLRLLPHMEAIEVKPKDVIYREGHVIDYVYFPISAVLSMVVPTSDGHTVEIATVGNNGFTGITALLGGRQARAHGALVKVFTVVPGTVIRLDTDTLIATIEHNLDVWRCIHRYLSVLFVELALSVSCNRLHSLQQRCARWLLSAVDKSEGNDVTITQEMLAALLGVYRQTLIPAITDFESKRLVETGRGFISVIDRNGLADLACECYAIAKRRMGGVLNILEQS